MQLTAPAEWSAAADLGVMRTDGGRHDSMNSSRRTELKDGALRVAGILLVIFAAANTLVILFFMAWWPRPETLLEQWVLMPVSLLLWAPQFPSYAAFDYVETLGRFGFVESHLAVTAMSTLIYTPLAMWWRRRRRRAA